MRILAAVTVVAASIGSMAWPGAALAQTRGGMQAAAEFGVGSAWGKLALLGSLGIDLSTSWVGVTVSPPAVIMQGGEDTDRYRRESNLDGDVCVDRYTRRTYPESFCVFLGATFSWDPNAELHLSGARLGVPLRLGVGVRGSGAGPLTWSMAYVSTSTGPRRYRVRLLFSDDAWHIGFGVLTSGSTP